MTPAPITIGLVEDHHLVRASLRLLLEAEPDFEVVDEAADGLLALDMVRNHRPCVLVLDLMLPGIGGLDVVRRVAREGSETAVIIWSTHAHIAYVQEALRNGAMGYVLKSAERGELAAAIRRVANGRRYLCSALSERAIEALASERAGSGDPLSELTKHEVEALQLAVADYSVAEIADRLSIRLRTAEKRRARAIKKLGLGSLLDLPQVGIVDGLLPAPDGTSAS